MNHLSLSLELNHCTNAQIKALSAFIESFDGSQNAELSSTALASGLTGDNPKEETPAEETKKKPTSSRKKTSTTSEAFADKQREDSAVDEYMANNTEVNEPEIIDSEDEDFVGGGKEVTLDTIRAKITAELLANNRDALKAKVASLGAEKLVDLKPNTWAAMDKFIDTLK